MARICAADARRLRHIAALLRSLRKHHSAALLALSRACCRLPIHSPLPCCRFERVDGRDLAALRALCPGSGSWDLVCVDLSGKASQGVLAPLLATLLEGLPQSRFVVKNEALYCALEAQAAQHVEQQQQEQGREPPADEREQQESEGAQQQQHMEEQGAKGQHDAAATESQAQRELEAALAAVLPHCERYTDTTFVAHALKSTPRRTRAEGSSGLSRKQRRQQQRQQREQQPLKQQGLQQPQQQQQQQPQQQQHSEQQQQHP